MNKVLRRNSIRQNLSWGIRWGLIFATGFTVLGLIPALIRAFSPPGSFGEQTLSFAGIVASYFFGGVAGGIVVGLLRDLMKWWLGRRIIGIAAAVPFIFAVRVLVEGHDAWTLEDVAPWIFAAVVYGVAMSFAPEPWAKKAEHARRAEGGER